MRSQENINNPHLQSTVVIPSLSRFRFSKTGSFHTGLGTLASQSLSVVIVLVPQLCCHFHFHFHLQGSSWPRDRTLVSCITGKFFTSWATGKSPGLSIQDLVLPTHPLPFKVLLKPWNSDGTYRPGLKASRNPDWDLNPWFVLFCGCAIQHVRSQFPDQGLNLCPLHWKHGVLITGPPGKSWPHGFLIEITHLVSGLNEFQVLQWETK